MFTAVPAHAQEPTQIAVEEMVITPAGPMLKSHVFEVPSGSCIEETTNEIRVYASRYDAERGGNKILVIRKEQGKKDSVQPAAQGWIEDARNSASSIAEVGRFQANWTVPSSPPRFGGAGICDFLFPGLQPDAGGKIIQPVLQYGHSDFGDYGKWYGASWYVSGGYSIHSPGISTDVGHGIYGYMQYWSGANPGWSIYFQDTWTGQATDLETLETTQPFSPYNVDAFIALEGYGVSGDIDVPGDTTFTSISFKNVAGGSIAVPLDRYYWPGWSGILTGLRVDILDSNTKVILNTAN